jgi:hypothetical protein
VAASATVTDHRERCPEARMGDLGRQPFAALTLDNSPTFHVSAFCAARFNESPRLQVRQALQTLQ